MLYRYPETLLKAHRICNMETVRHLKTIGIAFMNNRSEERISVPLHSPCVVKIILGSCSVKAWIFLPIDEEHIIPLTPPASLIVLNSQITSYIMARSLYIQNRIVSFSFEVCHIIDLRRVCLYIRSPSVTWVLTSPAGMEISGIFIQRLFVHLIINIKI